jgi:hypothetical protein
MHDRPPMVLEAYASGADGAIEGGDNWGKLAGVKHAPRVPQELRQPPSFMIRLRQGPSDLPRSRSNETRHQVMAGFID